MIPPGRPGALARGGTTVALLAAAALFLWVGHAHYPIARWLVWTYLGFGFLCAAWASACAAAGHVVLRRGLRVRLPHEEHVVLSLAAGVLIFGLGIFVLGLAGLLTPWTFALWPLTLLAACGPSSARDALRWTQRARAIARGRARPRSTGVGLATRVFGGVGLLLVYLPIMTPANVGYDARWYHLGLAEHYAALGRIAPLPEGWFQGTLPHLASWLYTWAFLTPRTDLFAKIEIAAHLEFTLFLATLAGIPPLVRRLTGGRAHRASWAALFLFPGIFLYDSNLNLNADHVLAFWAIPITLAFLRVARHLDARHGVLLGAMLAGAALTKYQSVYFAAGLIVLIAFAATDALRDGAAGRRRLVGLGAALAVAGAVVLVVTAPHWLKNWVFHGNPVYPFAHHVLGGHPWTAGTVVKIEDAGWRPTGGTASQFVQSLGAVFTFSFHPHDWPDFHRDIPVFGSLFTLLLLPMGFLRGTRLIWALAAAACAGVFTWFWTYHQDRYLQALLPWMAAVTAAALIRLWGTGTPSVRAGVGLLVGLQVVWGADVAFLPTHTMLRHSPFEDTLRLFSSSYRRAFAEQHDARTELPRIGARIARGAMVLLHEEHVRLGLGHPALSDSYGRQAGIAYQELASPDAVHRRMRELGVTHVVWKEEPRGWQRVADDLVFYEFVRLHTESAPVGRYRISALGDAPPAWAPTAEHVAVIGCGRVVVAPSLAEVDRAWTIAARSPCARAAGDPPELEAIREARFILVDDRRSDVRGLLVGPEWQTLFHRDQFVGYGRRPARRRSPLPLGARQGARPGHRDRGLTSRGGARSIPSSAASAGARGTGLRGQRGRCRPLNT